MFSSFVELVLAPLAVGFLLKLFEYWINNRH